MREQAAKKVGEKLLQELRNPRVAAPIVCTACKPVTFPFLEVNGADLSKKPPDWKSDYAKDLEAYSGDSENDGGKLHSISGASLHTANLRYLKAQGAQLVRADLNEADLRGAFFLNAKLQSAVLNHAQASGAHFDLAYLQGASLIQANLRDATMLLVDLRNAKLSGADLRNADLTGAKLQGAVFYSDQLPPDLASAHLHGTILNGATYDATTKWPPGFDPKKAKAIKAGTPPGGSLTP